MYVVYHILYVCVCVCVCTRVRECLSVFMFVRTICSYCESYNVNSTICYIMKYKMYFEVILISIDEVNFNMTVNNLNLARTLHDISL